jgi:hypothetical protein
MAIFVHQALNSNAPLAATFESHEDKRTVRSILANAETMLEMIDDLANLHPGFHVEPLR